MKNIMIILGMFAVFSCKAQTLPLNTALNAIPANAYVKDLNNELTPYIGTYKGNFQNKEITLIITKKDDKLEVRSTKQFHRDALVIKYIVKNSLGNILQDTQNNAIPKIELYSIATRPLNNSVIFYYSGTNCRVGWGDIFLKKISNTQISWEYRPDNIIIDDKTCPPGTDINIYLPETKDLIFTKQ
ncbi:DUF6705 family protein [Chryseobacterium sp. SIMBA_028]|uniref:DUF6705 family protein n=1 Tax=Chryseobacterium sp. SIMBA_028 TaxID=3085771 RepID=UPI0039798C91